MGFCSGVVKWLDTLLVLLWKELRLRFRSPISSFFELTVHLGVYILFYYLQGEIYSMSSSLPQSPDVGLTSRSREHVGGPAIFDRLSFNELLQASDLRAIYYTPPEMEPLVKTVAKMLSVPQSNVISFHNELHLMSSKLEDLAIDKHKFAVIFDDFNANMSISELAHLKYKIRNNRLYHIERSAPEFGDTNPHEQYGVVYESFVALQMAIDRTFIEMKTGEAIPQGVSVQMFPYLQTYDDSPTVINTYRSLYPSMTINAMMLFGAMLTSRLSKDKTTGIKALVKTAGCSSASMYLASVLAAIVMTVPGMLISSYLMSITAERAPSPWPSMDMGILFITYMLYMVQVACVSALSATIMPSHYIATAVTLAILIGFHTLLAQLPENTVRGFYSWLPNGVVIWFYEVVGQMHMRGQDLNWSAMFSTVPGEQGIFIMWLVVMGSCIPYIIVIWYMDLILPGPYGVPERWNFVFTKKFWFNVEEDTSSIAIEPNEITGYFEPDPVLPIGIRISNLWKIFRDTNKQKHAAVAGVSLNLYDREITVLLGQNGAGKTTLMSIITGMTQQSKGNVDFLEGTNGRKITQSGLFKQNSKVETETSKQRQVKRPRIGYCPQSNALMDNLTCRDHLIFFAKLHHGIFHSVDTVVNQALKSVNLKGDKAGNRSSVLSGGEKRRLQLGCALASGARTLVLDEPTSGLDPRARRSLWDILLKLRGSHTVLVSTHYMDEADALSDRIAVMRLGQLVCFGTPMFLKRAFGTGYRLTILKTPSCDPLTLQTMVQETTEGSTTSSSSGEQVIFKLPSDHSHTFPDLFNKLENNKQALGITTIGVGITTLEEIFLKVANDENEETVKIKSAAGETIPVDPVKIEQLGGFKLFVQRIKALTIKRVMYEKNSMTTTLIVQVLLPIAIAIGAIILANLNLMAGRATEQVMDPVIYPHLSTVYYADSKSTHGDILHKILNHSHNSTIKTVKTNNITKAILTLAKDDINTFLDGSLFAVEFEDNSYNVLYSTSVYHALPVVTNLIDNIIAYEMLSKSTSKQLNTAEIPLIRTTNEPIRRDLSETAEEKSVEDIIIWSTLVSFALYYQLLPASSLPARERGGARLLARMCGAPPYFLWLFSTIWDFAFHMVICCIIILITFSLEMENTLNKAAFLGSVLGLFAIHGLAGLALLYLLSFMSRSTAVIAIMYLGLSVIFGTILSFILFGLYLVDEESSTVAIVLRWISNCVPHYPLTRGLLNMGYIAIQNQKCVITYQSYSQFCSMSAMFPPVEGDFSPVECCETKVLSNGELLGPHSYFSGNHSINVGEQYLILAIQAVVFMSLVLILDTLPQGCLWSWITAMRRTPPPKSEIFDDAITAEKDYVTAKVQINTGKKYWADSENALICHDVHKSHVMYTKKPIRAVRGVSIAAKRGECFGVLGVNGAGKSSLLTILVGLSSPTRGNAFANGNNLKAAPRKYLSQIGYCPQFDALSPFLSARQQLAMLLKLQGVSQSEIESEIDKWIRTLGLELVMNKISRKYSGGQRRRLSAACALLLAARGDLTGHARGIALLDEPTAGVDPAAARRLWTALKQEQANGSSVLISTHSMHETEMLCDRVSIMSQGEMVALGSCAALRAKFSWGYTATLKLVGIRIQDLPDGGVDETEMLELNQGHSKDLKLSFMETFPSAELKDDRQTMLQYRIVTRDLTYGDLFTKMEALKTKYPDVLEDYAVSETTLEEVFLSLSERDVSTA